jgi:hypothetical protein
MGETVNVTGVAWDGGYGIGSVAVSVDGGMGWREATLGNDLGRFAFRPSVFVSRRTAQVRAPFWREPPPARRNQVDMLIFNPAGYHNNVVRPTTIMVG